MMSECFLCSVTKRIGGIEALVERPQAVLSSSGA